MKINKRKFRNLLNESVIDTNDSKMQIIADVGDADYYIRRAVEEIRRFDMLTRQSALTDAITLLTLAKYVLEQEKVIL